MKKIELVVHNCSDCPWMRHTQNAYCWHPEVRGNKKDVKIDLGWQAEPPKNCPLPDIVTF